MSFAEAATVLADSLAITVFDPDHSVEKAATSRSAFRLVLACCLSRIPTAMSEFVSLVRESSPARNEKTMNKETTTEMDDELRPAYDLAHLLKDGVQGKYAERYRSGTNVVLLAPDVARAFPDEATVNEALRLVMRITALPVGSTSGPASILADQNNIESGGDS